MIETKERKEVRRKGKKKRKGKGKIEKKKGARVKGNIPHQDELFSPHK